MVDDDRQIVRLLGAYLEQDGFETLLAYDGEQALHVLRRERPDLVILDLMLPERDGREITRLVRGDTALRHVPIIMLTARSEEADRVVGLELGADDYVTKPFSPREVVARVRAVLRRTSPDSHPPQLVRVHDLELDLSAHNLIAAGRPAELTPSEFEILRALMQSPGHAFTRLELIEAAFGYVYEGMDRTVDSHIKNLRRKLAPEADAQVYIETVYGVGYRLRGDR
ncbi:MAG: response regulator transcription factor [Anaerolineae bacterium]